MPIQLSSSTINVRNPENNEYVALNSFTTLTREMVENLVNAKADSIVERISEDLEAEKNQLLNDIQVAGNDKKLEIEEINPYIVVTWNGFLGRSETRYNEKINSQMQVVHFIISDMSKLDSDLTITTDEGSMTITGSLKKELNADEAINIILFLFDVSSENFIEPSNTP